jgi:hypothetical protein
LKIVAAIVRSIVYDDPEQGRLDNISPSKFFNVIAGAGTGG